jgi:hypothetical protein
VAFFPNQKLASFCKTRHVPPTLFPLAFPIQNAARIGFVRQIPSGANKMAVIGFVLPNRPQLNWLRFVESRIAARRPFRIPQHAGQNPGIIVSLWDLRDGVTLRQGSPSNI